VDPLCDALAVATGSGGSLRVVSSAHAGALGSCSHPRGRVIRCNSKRTSGERGSMSSASDSVRFMVRCRCVGLSALLLGSLLLPIGATAASVRISRPSRGPRRARGDGESTNARGPAPSLDDRSPIWISASGVAGAPSSPTRRRSGSAWRLLFALRLPNRVPRIGSRRCGRRRFRELSRRFGLWQRRWTVLSVKQSRLGFRGYVPTPVGEIKTKF
jgi:hypothetical protein